MSAINDSLRSVSATPPRIDVRFIANAVSDQYGLSGSYVELVSERDQNFRLVSSDERQFVIKINSLEEGEEEADFQVGALLHLEQFGEAGVPQVVRTQAGLDRGVVVDADGKAHRLRVVTWLDGRLFCDCETTPAIVAGLGNRLAMLDQALLEYSHSADQRVLLWDMQRAAVLLELTGHINEPATREIVEIVLQQFSARVEPLLRFLPTQVIHNDANPENILLDANDSISGIIDFGDMLRAPRVVEVATAASYLRPASDDPFFLVAPFVAAYHSASPLIEGELAILYDLIRTRLAMTLTILYWRQSAREPGDPYRMKVIRSEGNAVKFLQTLSAAGQGSFDQRIDEEFLMKTND
jgi:hydroxylysine kinase